MRNLLLALAALISIGAQATTSHRGVKQIDAMLSLDAKVVADAAPVAWSGAIPVGTVGQTPMYVNHLVGDAVYSAERLVRNAIATGECTLGSQVPGLAEGVTCAIVLPNKVITVALIGTAGVIEQIIVDVIIGIPAALLDATSEMMGHLADALGPIAGIPFIIVTGVVTAAGEFLQVVGYVVEAGVTTVVEVVTFVMHIPCHLFKIFPLPPSPCDGVGKDKNCLK